MAFVRGIPVRDANGDQLVVYEFNERRFIRIRKVSHFRLDTGEPVERLGARLFRLANGELLATIDGDDEPWARCPPQGRRAAFPIPAPD